MLKQCPNGFIINYESCKCVKASCKKISCGSG